MKQLQKTQLNKNTICMGKIKKWKQKQRETEIHGQCKGKAIITTKNAKNKADNERSRKKRACQL